MSDPQPHSGMTAAELERLRIELKVTIAHSAEMISRVDALLTQKEFPALDETTDGLFHSRSRPRLAPPTEPPAT